MGSTSYAYNTIPVSPTVGAGKLASVDGPLANDTVSYVYDELGRVLNRSVNGTANSSTLVYDTLGRTTSVTNNLGAFTYAYLNATGRLDHVDYPNGQRTNYSYFGNAGDQRLQQIANLKSGGANLSTFGYTYNPTGSIQTWSQQVERSAAKTLTIGYDLADQVISAVASVGGSMTQEYRYGYDLAGNRTSEQIGSGVTAATHNAVNQVTGLSPSGPIRFSGSVNEPANVTVNGSPATIDGAGGFTANIPLSPGTQTVQVSATDGTGNTATQNYQVTVAGGTTRTLAYDGVGNLTNDGAGKTYEWDAAGRLVKITQVSGVTEFVYNGLSQRVQEKLAGTVVKQWIWEGGAQPVEERDASNAVTKRFFAQGEEVGGSAYFHVVDHLGSVRVMTDTSGTTRARYDYDAFGRHNKTAGDLESDFGFTGFYRHQPSGLSLTLYRAYDSNLGRWLSWDPIEEEGGVNLYGYVRNDPFNATDPLGLSPAWAIPTQVANNREFANSFNATATWGAGALVVIPVVILAETLIPITVGLRNCNAAENAAARGAVSAGARTEAVNLTEQLALKEAQGGAGQRIMKGAVKDTRFPEDVWAKMEHVHKAPGGGTTTIHYWKNLQTGEGIGFKFKNP